MGAEEANFKEESSFQSCIACLQKDRMGLRIDGFPANSTDVHVVGRQEIISASDTVAEAMIP